MMPSRALVISCLVSLLLGGCLGVEFQDPDAGGSQGTPESRPALQTEVNGTISLLDLSLPDYEGNIALSGELPMEPEVACELHVELSGMWNSEGLGGWVELDGNMSGLAYGRWIDVHAPVFHTREIDQDRGRWAFALTWPMDLNQPRAFTVAGAGLESWTDGTRGGKALTVSLACSEEVPLKLLGATGDRITMFTDGTIGGGAGLDPGTYPRPVHANVEDSLRIVTSGPVTLLRLREGSPSQRSADVFQSGAVSVESPEGRIEKELRSADTIDPISLNGGPGTYVVSIDQVAVDGRPIYGFIGDLGPLHTPPDLVPPDGPT